MDITKIITQHTNFLNETLNSFSLDQRKDLIKTLLHFYFLLPDFEKTIEYHLKINIEKNDLIFKIENNELDDYRKANQKSIEDLDPYDENYEEIEEIETNILDAFSFSISDLNNSDYATRLFIGIINILDYYENFSDDPKYWNNLLELEINFQKTILLELISGTAININIYHERYKDVIFDKI